MFESIRYTLRDYPLLRLLATSTLGALMAFLIMLFVIGGGGLLHHLALEMGATQNGAEGIWFMSSLIILMVSIIVGIFTSDITL